jgi:Fe-S cluster assembly protein SufD
MAEISLLKTPAETGLARAFEALRPQLPGESSRRLEAFERFAERGLPHRRVEEFKYTDLRNTLREVAPPATALSVVDARAAVANAHAFMGVAAARLAIVNGHVSPEASALGELPAGVELLSFAEASASAHPVLAQLAPVAAARDNPLYQLNTAFMTDGAVIRIAARTAVEQPIHLAFLAAGGSAVSTATRTLVVVEEGASVTLLESHESPNLIGFQANDVVEFVVGNGASVRHVRLNAEGRETIALSTLTAKLGADVSFDSLNAVVGGDTSRHQVYVAFEGEHSLARINGATMIKGRQHADSTLVVDHQAPHCGSRELFKTVIDDEATGVFQGKIVVRPEAQKTDGRMMSASLLLSEWATMNNKPELEIFADDVQCGHGATNGALDEDLLFYLMARGLPRAEAESLLVQAFVGEAIETVENESVREALIATVEAWLAARG